MSEVYQSWSLPDITLPVRSICFVCALVVFFFVSVGPLFQSYTGLVCPPDCPSPSNQYYNQDPDFPPFHQDPGELESLFLKLFKPHYFTQIWKAGEFPLNDPSYDELAVGVVKPFMDSV